jgi:hypothetical protein
VTKKLGEFWFRERAFMRFIFITVTLLLSGVILQTFLFKSKKPPVFSSSVSYFVTLSRSEISGTQISS